MNARERLVLQAEAVRRALAVDGAPAAGHAGLDVLLRATDGAAAELADRLADHGRLLRDLEERLGPDVSARVPAVLDGSVEDRIAVASRLVDEAQALLATAATADAALAERERRVLDDLRRSDAVGLA